MLRVLPVLIRVSSAIKSKTSAKSNFLYSSQSVKKLGLEATPVPLHKNMSTDIDKELNDPKRHFDYDQLIQKKDKENAIVIDVREPEEINETGKIPGSIHIPLNELKTALIELSSDEFFNSYKINKPNIEDEVIFTCRSVAEVKKALGEMSEEEFKNKYQADKPPKDKEIIFSCKLGGRSFKALKLGLELGYNKAGNYKGGWMDWAEKSKPSK